MHTLHSNYVNLQKELNDTKNALPSSGKCPICFISFQRLKTHFNSCFMKKHSQTDDQLCSGDSSNVSEKTRGNKANSKPSLSATIDYSKSSFDFNLNKWKCVYCDKYYKELKSKFYENHLRKEHSDKLVSDFPNLVNDNYFLSNNVPHSDAGCEIEPPLNAKWLDDLKDSVIEKRFNVLHININSILGDGKLISIESMLNSGFLHILCVQETKIDSDTPDSHFTHLEYNIYRRDRMRGGGGLLIYVKKDITVLSNINDTTFETITLTLKIRNKLVDFIFSYNPHYEYSNDFLIHIEEKIKSLPPCRPIFILGDFNQDLLSVRGDKLKAVMLDYNFSTLIDTPTHFVGDSSSLIDVFFCNKPENIIKSSVLPCPFSNHYFIISSLNFVTNYSTISKSINSRSLNEKNLNLIRDEVRVTDFNIAKKYCNIDERWHVIKRIFLSIIDKHAPFKKIRLKKRDHYPWVDNELLYHIALRDQLHDIAVASKRSRIDSAEWLLRCSNCIFQQISTQKHRKFS